MKKLVVASLALFSVSAFSQSYFILNNGVTLTLDKAGLVYDFNHFFLPYKVQVNGGQFLVSEKKLHTVDTQGLLYQKDVKVEKIKGKGLNYMINDDNHLLTVDEKGFSYDYDKDKSVFKKAVGFGGNFFTVKMDDKKPQVDLYTINSKGNYFKMVVEGLNNSDITTLGGNWFTNKLGVVHTVSKDGNVFPKGDIKVGSIVRRGGNYLIDNTGKIFTVSEEGYLMLPALPMSFKVSNIVKVGSSYMFDAEGRMFAVDAQGNVLERAITNHDSRTVKVLSL